MPANISSLRHPYLKMKNLSKWISDKQARKELGLIDGFIIFKNLYLTEDEFKKIHPVELQTSTKQIDGRAIV